MFRFTLRKPHKSITRRLHQKSPSKGKIITSGVVDTRISMSVEQYLYRSEFDYPILFIRQARPTVILGCNQNAWLDCNIHKLNKGGVDLMRRCAGGGAEYVDQGTLLVSFIGNHIKYPLLSPSNCEQLIEIAIHQAFNVDVTTNSRYQFMANGMKVGNTSFESKPEPLDSIHTLYQTSLFVNTNLEAMKEYTKNDNSVANLLTCDSESTIDDLRNSIKKNFKLLHYPVTEFKQIEIDEIGMKRIPGVRQIYDEIYTINHIYSGGVPRFNKYFYGEYDWGYIRILLQVDHGVITDISCSTDSMIIVIPHLLRDILMNTKYSRVDVYTTLGRYIERETIGILNGILRDVRELMFREMY